MSYYTTNAVYKLLDNCPMQDLVWVSGNAWALLYADAEHNVRAVACLTGSSMAKAGGLAAGRLNSVRAVCRDLALSTGLPFAAIEFDEQSPSLSQVSLNGNETSTSQLKDWFAATGLPVNAGSAAKAINSAESSVYHRWQRSHLGAINVSDIDLFRLEPASTKIRELIELKRSFYRLDQWRPYPQDFPNFNTIAGLAQQLGSRLTIAYNRRQTKPAFNDDASVLSLFDYRKNVPPQVIGQFLFTDFAQGTYLR